MIQNCLAAAAKSLQSCPTLCDPIDGSPPGSTIPGILQARTLEWVAISLEATKRQSKINDKLRKIFASHISASRFTSLIYKEFIQTNKINIKRHSRKMVKGNEQTLQKENTNDSNILKYSHSLSYGKRIANLNTSEILF